MSPGMQVGTIRELGSMRHQSGYRAFEAFLEDVEARIEHVLWNVERGDVSHRRIATREQDQAVLVRVLLDCIATLRVGLPRVLVFHVLRVLYQPEPPAFPDELKPIGQLVDAA